MSWENLVHSGLQKVLEEHLKLQSPTPIQISALHGIDSVSRDYLVKAKTGSGKTLAFLLPILSLILRNEKLKSRTDGTLLLYIAPTRELAVQTHRLVTSILSRLKPHWMTAVLLCGSSHPGEDASYAGTSRKREKESLRKGQTVVIGTPGRILDHLQTTQSWIRSQLQSIVLDEADRLMDRGFGPKVKEIIGLIKNVVDRPSIIYCSATAKPDQAVIELNNLKIITDTDDALIEMPSKLQQQFLVCPTKQRLAALVGLFRDNKRGRTVVFVSCCDSVDYHYSLFGRSVPECQFLRPSHVFRLHGSLPSDQRRESLAKFSECQDGAVLFCTDVAARGLNVPDVQLIIQYEPPSDRLDYVHRAGRTARGMSTGGRNVLMLHESEAAYIDLLQEKCHLDRPQQIEPPLGWLNDSNGKLRWGLWQREVVTMIGKNSELLSLAKRAYSSAIRAYATHPVEERSIFHIKRLHLGHLAATFGLGEEAISTSSMASSRARHEKEKQSMKRKTSGAQEKEAKTQSVAKRPKAVSEFSAY